jgi:peptidoglycan/LPS O-acetylase OafA/YrhL
MPPSLHDRALEIDGIRGWASFSVLLYHTFHEMFTRLLPWVNSAWLAPLFEGRLAVCIFFVLSGDALTTAFFARGGVDPAPIDRLVVRRYTRLTVPIVMSCSLVFVLRLIHADWHNPASDIVNRPDWLGEMIAFDFSATGLFRYSLLGVYANHTKATSYNPFLWTMSLEMVGSILAFLTCYLWPRFRNGKTLVAVMAVLLFALDSFFCLFFAGMFLGLLRIDSFYAGAAAGNPQQAVWLAGFIALVLLLVAKNGHSLPLFFDLAMAVAFVFVLYAQRGLRGFLRGRLSTWVGDMSFPIYLVQFAVIISFESWLVTVWNEHRAATGWLPLIGLSSVVVTLLAAWIFRQAERTILSHLDGVVLRVLRRN